MDNVQKLQLRQSELKVQINEMLESTLETRSATFTSDLGNLTRDAKGVEVELQAAIIAAPTPWKPARNTRTTTLRGASSWSFAVRQISVGTSPRP